MTHILRNAAINLHPGLNVSSVFSDIEISLESVDGATMVVLWSSMSASLETDTSDNVTIFAGLVGFVGVCFWTQPSKVCFELQRIPTSICKSE